MRVELSHHYGWQEYEIPGAESLHDAAYKAVRQTHDFLTDTNHAHDAWERKSTWGGREIRWNSIRVFRGEGAPAYAGPKWAESDYWFAVEYRDPAAMSQEGDSNG